MRRVLVPLNGTALSESILPDARRLAGPDGTLILIRDVHETRYEEDSRRYTLRAATKASEEYLTHLAGELTAEGVRVETRLLAPDDVAWAIDTAAEVLSADAIACATHGRGPFGRFWWGSVAWRAIAQSPVPVLVRHGREDGSIYTSTSVPTARTIMVPLDGSAFAEAALPLARTLALEWQARLLLARVVPAAAMYRTPLYDMDHAPIRVREDFHNARVYLDQVAPKLPDTVTVEVTLGSPVADVLVDAATEHQITDIVMTSHGRTGLARAILGSVADSLIQHLHCPIIVIPAFAVETARHERRTAGPETAGRR